MLVSNVTNEKLVLVTPEWINASARGYHDGTTLQLSSATPHQLKFEIEPATCVAKPPAQVEPSTLEVTDEAFDKFITDLFITCDISTLTHKVLPSASMTHSFD